MLTDIVRMKITRFEDLEIWKEARELSGFVYKVTSSAPFYKDYRFKDQIRASAGSIMDNIAEGFERGGNKEFCQFLSISKGSTGELRSQIYRAYDNMYLSEDEYSILLERTDSISKKIFNLIQYLKKSDIKGLKFM